MVLSGLFWSKFNPGVWELLLTGINPRSSNVSKGQMFKRNGYMTYKAGNAHYFFSGKCKM